MSIHHAEKILESAAAKPDSSEDERTPLLEVEINIDERTVEKCVIYKGELLQEVVDSIARKYSLNETERSLIINQLSKYF